MKRKIILPVLLPLLLFLTGCPYNSKIPLSIPKQPVDKALLGEWKNAKEPNDSSVLKIYEFNANEYALVIIDKTNNDSSVELLRAFLTPVGDKLLLNVESFKTRGEFNFCSYTLEGSTLKIKVVSDIVMKEKYESSKTMAKAFAKKMNDKDFFESELVFTKK
jgi:hypothetical protein